MTYYRQPWGRLEVTGRRCRLQVLDPETAFDIEPTLIERLGEHLALALAAPQHVFGSMWETILGDAGHGESLADAMRSPESDLKVATAGLRRMSQLLTRCMLEAKIDGKWVCEMFERTVLDRLRVDGDLIEDWPMWIALGLSPRARWKLLAAQMAQTFGPLWQRTPYSLKSRGKDFGVPVPTGVPKAVQWSDALVKMGHASSSHEILTSWTPDRLIDVVDLAAYQAETERRAHDAAMSQG